MVVLLYTIVTAALRDINGLLQLCERLYGYYLAIEDRKNERLLDIPRVEEPAADTSPPRSKNQNSFKTRTTLGAIRVRWVFHAFFARSNSTSFRHFLRSIANHAFAGEGCTNGERMKHSKQKPALYNDQDASSLWWNLLLIWSWFPQMKRR